MSENVFPSALLDSHLAQVNQGLMLALPTLSPLRLADREFDILLCHFGHGRLPRAARAETHRHAYWQIEACCEGQIEFLSQKARLLLQPNQAILIPPQMKHAWKVVQPAVMLGVHFQTPADPLHSADGSDPFSQRPPLACWLSLQNHGRASTWSDILPALLGRQAGWRPFAAFSFAAWFSSLVAPLLAEQSGAQNRAEPTRHAALVHQAEAFIQANFASSIGAEEVALHLGISSRHLNRLLTAQGRPTIGCMLQQTRLQQARQRLKAQPEASIKTIAYESGFARPSHFTQRFRQAFSITPSAARQ